MPTIREQIIAEAVTRLSTLTTDGCFRCIPYVDEDEFVAIWDQNEEATVSAYNRSTFELPLAVVYTKRYIKDDAPAVLNEMLAQVILAMFTGGDDFGGLAQSLYYSSSQMRHAESGSEFISVGVLFDVTYHTRTGDPYTQT